MWSSAHGCQKIASDPQELKLQTAAVSGSQCFELLSHLSGPRGPACVFNLWKLKKTISLHSLSSQRILCFSKVTERSKSQECWFPNEHLYSSPRDPTQHSYAGFWAMLQSRLTFIWLCPSRSKSAKSCFLDIESVSLCGCDWLGAYFVNHTGFWACPYIPTARIKGVCYYTKPKITKHIFLYKYIKHKIL